MLALTTEVYRLAWSHPLPTADLGRDGFTVDRLLALATREAVEELDQLREVAFELLPAPE